MVLIIDRDESIVDKTGLDKTYEEPLEIAKVVELETIDIIQDTIEKEIIISEIINPTGLEPYELEEIKTEIKQIELVEKSIVEPLPLPIKKVEILEEKEILLITPYDFPEEVVKKKSVYEIILEYWNKLMDIIKKVFTISSESNPIRPICKLFPNAPRCQEGNEIERPQIFGKIREKMGELGKKLLVGLIVVIAILIIIFVIYKFISGYAQRKGQAIAEKTPYGRMR